MLGARTLRAGGICSGPAGLALVLGLALKAQGVQLEAGVGAQMSTPGEPALTALGLGRPHSGLPQLSVPASVYWSATWTGDSRRRSGQAPAHSEEGMRNV